MKITARESGGFAGRTACYAMDTACETDGGALEALLGQLDVFGAPARQAAPGLDIPRWEITVEDGGRRRTLVLQEDGGPACARWQPVFDFLRRHAAGGASGA